MLPLLGIKHARFGGGCGETSGFVLTSTCLLQMTEKEAKRASISVRLLYEFLQLLQEAHTRARELQSLDR